MAKFVEIYVRCLLAIVCVCVEISINVVELEHDFSIKRPNEWNKTNQPDRIRSDADDADDADDAPIGSDPIRSLSSATLLVCERPICITLGKTQSGSLISIWRRSICSRPARRRRRRRRSTRKLSDPVAGKHRPSSRKLLPMRNLR